MLQSTLYRFAAHALFAPFGGVHEIRRRAVDALHLHSGARVLELGCGPGDVTAMLLGRGAVVHAIDGSAEMLRAVAVRAPGAHRVHADIRSYRPTTSFDAALLLFVLHEVPVHDIPQLLRTVATGLAPGGRLVIVDHAVPTGLAGSAWRRVLHAVESRDVEAWLALDPATLLADAGLALQADDRLARSRARLVAARRR